MYGINPFSAQNATRDVDPTQVPSVFGALPYPGTASSNPPANTLVTLRFTSFNPTVLNSKVVGPNNETLYRVASDDQQTVLKTGRGNIALVDWQPAPTVEAQSVGAKRYVGQWLQLVADRSARTMTHGGAYYIWAPHDRFLHLFAQDSSVWLARVTKSADAVLLELTPHAVQLGLMDAAVLATVLLLSGKRIE